MEYNELDKYCKSELQKKVIKLISDGVSKADTAKKLNIHERTVYRILAKVKARAKVKTSPDDPYIVTGKSTLLDNEGNVKLEWVKTSLDKKSYEDIIKTTIEEFKSELPKYPARTLSNSIHNENLLNMYLLTDYHLGMYSWEEETKENWDISIAEELLIKWVNESIERSPKAEKALLVQLGDFLHFDGLEAVTPTSNHVLDADTRFPLLVRTAIRLLRYTIDKLLSKYKQVHVIIATGNHDIASSIWLREALNYIYENEERISIDMSPDVYYAYKHGNTSLFFHHGHKRNVNNITETVIGKFREIYGTTKYSYVHLGHLHSKKLQENSAIIIEQHRTLAAPDSYASQGGWLSGREAQIITYHKEYGEVSRLMIKPEML